MSRSSWSRPCSSRLSRSPGGCLARCRRHRRRPGRARPAPLRPWAELRCRRGRGPAVHGGQSDRSVSARLRPSSIPSPRRSLGGPRRPCRSRSACGTRGHHGFGRERSRRTRRVSARMVRQTFPKSPPKSPKPVKRSLITSLERIQVPQATNSAPQGGQRGSCLRTQSTISQQVKLHTDSQAAGQAQD